MVDGSSVFTILTIHWGMRACTSFASSNYPLSQSRLKTVTTAWPRYSDEASSRPIFSLVNLLKRVLNPGISLLNSAEVGSKDALQNAASVNVQCKLT